MLTGLVTIHLPAGHTFKHRLFGRGKVLARTPILPDFLTLVRFNFRKRDGSIVATDMAIFTDYIVDAKP